MGSTAPVQVASRTAAQEHALQQLKWLLVAPPILALPRERVKYVGDIDSCDSQIGGTILQEQEHGRVQPVVYVSWTQDISESAFGVTAKECLAVLWASLQLRAYQEGSLFLGTTDEDCLRWIMSIDSTGNARFAQWRLQLKNLEIDVTYKP